MIDTLKLGYVVPEVLIPASEEALSNWSVIACDQYTSQPDYWKQVKERAGNSPSALNVILPEVILDTGDVDAWVTSMHEAMKDYVQSGVLKKLPAGIVLTERQLKSGVRKGILLAMDLESYDYNIENHPLIRASERTVLERIPPRKKAREGATLDVPHVMLLIDDSEDKVIGPLHDARAQYEVIYDFDLMAGGGHVAGWLVTDPDAQKRVAKALGSLKRYDGMLYCVGDGNHSLATAKAIWDEAKKDLSEEERETSPLRYAMCEVVNVHEPAVEFLPIHRVFFNTTVGSLMDYTVRELKAQGIGARLSQEEPEVPTDGFALAFFSKKDSGWLVIEKATHPLAAGMLQPIFDAYLKENEGARIDYIHGDDVVQELSAQENTVGILFPPVPKDDFFSLVVRCGVLPRKTFSIGEADDKRFYLEARLLTPAEQE